MVLDLAELAAMRRRDAAAVPEMLREPHVEVPTGNDAFVRAEMDRRALLKELDRRDAEHALRDDLDLDAIHDHCWPD